MLSRFEITRIISARALQLSLGAPALIKLEKKDSFYDVAIKEFDAKLLPIAVVRTYPNGTKQVISA